MNNEIPPSRPKSPRIFREVWWTPEREALNRWFLANAEHLAPVYVGAVYMAMNESFPGRVHFVAHAIREIRNRLPDAVAGEEVRGRRAEDLSKRLSSIWNREGFPSDGSLPLAARVEPSLSGADCYEISGDLMKVVSDHVADQLRGSYDKTRNARRLFEAAVGTAPPSYVVKDWLRRSDWAEKYMHVGNRSLRPTAEAEVIPVFEEFERSLLALSIRPHENLEALDEILESANR